MSVKEMAKGITYDDPIKTRCVSQYYSGCLAENTASSQLKRTRSHAAPLEECCSVATSFSLAPLSGFLCKTEGC